MAFTGILLGAWGNKRRRWNGRSELSIPWTRAYSGTPRPYLSAEFKLSTFAVVFATPFLGRIELNEPFNTQWQVTHTTSYNILNSVLRPKNIFVCSVWFLQQTATVPLDSIDRLVFVAETWCFPSGTDWIHKCRFHHQSKKKEFLCLFFCEASTSIFTSSLSLPLPEGREGEACEPLKTENLVYFVRCSLSHYSTPHSLSVLLLQRNDENCKIFLVW